MTEFKYTQAPETKEFSIQEMKIDNDSGTISGYASVFDITDRGGDRVTKGAFHKSLEENPKIKMLWQHDPSQPIGVWDEVKEDDKGLFVKGRIISGIAKGKETLVMVKEGILDSLSIGYRTVSAVKKEGAARDLTELELWEISVVTFPMLKEAQFTESKAAENEIELKTQLVSCGYTEEQATAIVKGGFAAYKKANDPELDATSIQKLLDNINAMKGAING